MKIKKSFWDWSVFAASVAIALIDIGLSSFFHIKFGEQTAQKTFIDVAVVMIAGLTGKYFALKTGLPLWWLRDPNIKLRRQLLILITLGLSMTIINTSIYYYSKDYVSAIPWLDFSNLNEPILLALRAGIQEEILFRLFIFTLSVFLVNKVTSLKNTSVIIGILLSAFAFGLMHGFYFAYISGAVLAYIFYKNGLIPAIVIHFLSDVLPWTLLYIWRS